MSLPKGMIFTLNIKPRTKKNHGNIVTLKNGRQMMLPSKQYREFEKEVCDWMEEFLPDDFVPIDYPVNLQCKFYKDRDYKADLTGYLQAIQDALVKAKFLLDDNHKIVATTDGSEVLLDKVNPRIEIKVKRKE